MEILVVSSLSDLKLLISNIKNYSNTTTQIHVNGEIYSDISRTYAALGKCNKDKSTGKVGVFGGIAGGVLATIFTGGLALPAVLAGSATAFAAGSNAMVGAVKEFRASPYADEVYLLSEQGFNVVRNAGNALVLGAD